MSAWRASIKILNIQLAQCVKNTCCKNQMYNTVPWDSRTRLNMVSALNKAILLKSFSYVSQKTFSHFSLRRWCNLSSWWGNFNGLFGFRLFCGGYGAFTRKLFAEAKEAGDKSLHSLRQSCDRTTHAKQCFRLLQMRFISWTNTLLPYSAERNGPVLTLSQRLYKEEILREKNPLKLQVWGWDEFIIL